MRQILIALFLMIFLSQTSIAYADPESTNYKISKYEFGAGGGSTTSTTYDLFGILGEQNGSGTSTTYKFGAGLTYLLKSNVPSAPTFTNPATNYDRLKFVINDGGNPTDTTFAIAISTDNFVADTRYIKSDNTIGASLASSDYQTYTNWGGATGEFVTGLNNNITYYIKVKARQGNFTESEYSAVSSTTTSNPSLSFGVDSPTITFSNLNAANSYTDSAKSTVLTTSTNAYNGYVVYSKLTGNLTSTGGDTITNFAGTNTTPTTWSGTGFGYTTDDTNLSGGTANRFSGSNYAGFVTSGNGDPVADHTAVVEDPTISNEQFNISYRITGDNVTPAGTYTTTIQYIVVPTY